MEEFKIGKYPHNFGGDLLRDVVVKLNSNNEQIEEFIKSVESSINNIFITLEVITNYWPIDNEDALKLTPIIVIPHEVIQRNLTSKEYTVIDYAIQHKKVIYVGLTPTEASLAIVVSTKNDDIELKYLNSRLGINRLIIHSDLTVDIESLELLSREDILNTLQSDSAVNPLSAKQGKILNEKKVDKVEGKGLSSNDFTDKDKSILENLSKELQAGKKLSSNDFTDEEKILVGNIVNKIDKVPNKGLSSNDFTDEYREKLENLSGGSGSGSGVEVVEKKEDLDNERLKTPGKPVFVLETDEPLYYSPEQEEFKSYTNVVEQKTSPKNTNYIWIDESNKSIPEYTNEDLRSINLAIVAIQETLNKYKFAFEQALVSGDFTNSARLKMLNAAEPIEPETGTKQILNSEIESEYPEWAEDMLPNLAHLSIKMGKYSEMVSNKQNFINGELLWCYDTSQLYILSKNQFIWINKGGGSGSGGGLDYDALDRLDTIGFVSSNGTNYRVKVQDNGLLLVYKKELDTSHSKPTGGSTDESGWEYTTALFLQKLYINSVYCGGLSSNEHSYNLCSHNFVELSNLTNNDISLKGLSLQYCNEGNDWEVLPLWGVIKSQSTFLIRGAQCSVLDVNTTRIKVDTFDMEWRDSKGELIKFDNNKAKFFLGWGTNKCPVNSPYQSDGTNIKVSLGYIDFVGLNKENASATDKVDGSEKSPYSYLNSNRIFTKYYNMDLVSQATKALTARNNANDWYFVDLDKDTIPTVDCYRPMSSAENKNIFFNKSKFSLTSPNCITCTFGIQATAPNATRCFNWVSVGYYDEYLWYRKKESSNWTKVESFKNETGVRKYYNRVRMEATDGTAFTTHKVIIKNLSSGEYEYKIGRDDVYISDTLEFTVKDSSEVDKGFTFVHVSDQQGFNRDEYEVWKKSADYIKNHVSNMDFTINTGDLTQNGNRINEWIDYYSGRTSLNSFPEMTTIGNNDLCPANIYNLGDGGDASKINSTNMTFFYTYEIDEENPPIFTIEGKEVYVVSLYSFNYGSVHFLCVNSEIPELTETNIYGLSSPTQVYDKMKEWCERDAAKNLSYSWRIAYCHEMPFTIITQNVIQKFFWQGVENNKIERSGSRMNYNTSYENKYWFSRFCQDNDYRLVLGGHKHTYSCSWPLKENVSNGTVQSMKPIIQVTASDLQTYFNSSALYTETEGDLVGQSFPESWRNDNNYLQHKHLCTFELVNKITAPVYSMSQATGYKHTSNKELPAPNIPWLKYYFPASIKVQDQNTITATVNAGQRYPFYTIWNITPTQLTGTAKKINYIFTSGGKFNINIPSSNHNPEAVGGNGEINQGNDLIIITK